MTESCYREILPQDPFDVAVIVAAPLLLCAAVDWHSRSGDRQHHVFPSNGEQSDRQRNTFSPPYLNK